MHDVMPGPRSRRRRLAPGNQSPCQAGRRIRFANFGPYLYAVGEDGSAVAPIRDDVRR
jgi:hypothetical protein